MVFRQHGSLILAQLEFSDTLLAMWASIGLILEHGLVLRVWVLLGVIELPRRVFLNIWNVLIRSDLRGIISVGAALQLDNDVGQLSASGGWESASPLQVIYLCWARMIASTWSLLVEWEVLIKYLVLLLNSCLIISLVNYLRIILRFFGFLQFESFYLIIRVFRKLLITFESWIIAFARA